MPKITIDLTAEENQAIQAMLKNQTVENYLKKLAENHIRHSLDDEFLGKSVEDKKKLLKK